MAYHRKPLVLGNNVQPFEAVEISDDEKIPIPRDYLKRWKCEVGMFSRASAPTHRRKS